MLPVRKSQKRTDFLTEEEATELSRFVGDRSVVGHVVFSADGDTLQSSAAPDLSVAVFANIFTIAQRMGARLGEPLARPMTIFETRGMEIVGIALSDAYAVVFRRNGAEPVEGLRDVG